jgi:RND superfamily putative drug exporter
MATLHEQQEIHKTPRGTGWLRARRAPALLLALGVLVAVAVIGLVGTASPESSAADQLPRGSDSAAAARLAERLPQADSSAAVVLLTSDGGTLSPAEVRRLTEVAQSLPGAARAPLTVSEDRTAALGAVVVPSTDATKVSTAVDEIRSELAASMPTGVTAQVTGPAGIQADLAAVFDGANTRLLLTTALVVAVLLIVTYRSPVLWLVPLTVVALADQLAAALATHLMTWWGVVFDESTTGILSVLVFGAGTDYALLLISRYRDELRVHESRREAMVRALGPTAEAVIASAATVVAGVLTLLLSMFPSTRGLGLACAVGIVVAAVFALVVLPAALVLCGRWVFWPRIPRPTGEASLESTHSWWRRVGDHVARRPSAYTAGALLFLVLASSVVPSIQTGLTLSDQFLKQPESIAAAQRLAVSFPAGASDPTTVLSTADPAAVQRAVEQVPGVASVRQTGAARGVSELQVVLQAAPSTPESKDTVTAIRRAVSDLPDTHVGGAEAESIDQSAAASRDRWLIFPVVLGLVLLSLVVLLRSLVAPVLLVGTVVATYAASLGLSWLVFQHVLGFQALDDNAPLFAFVFLVALGVDYNIFLVTRAREESRPAGHREGMLRALAATGGVITSAGILLAAVFAVLGVLPLVVLAQLGVIVGIGVLLDTLLVRTVLVPALALLLGERFWWPLRVSPATTGMPASAAAQLPT